MKTLYVSHSGCYVALKGETLMIKQGETIFAQVQLPLIEQILIFGKSQLTTQAIRACLWRNIPVAYLSRMGYCYGRIMSIERGYRQLAHYQQQLVFGERLKTARAIVTAKLKNSRILLRRQRRRHSSPRLEKVLKRLDYLTTQASEADSIERLLGFEGAGAAQYFEGFGECLSDSAFVFTHRTRRPPGNPVNAMLSFGYQILWNHLLALIELQGLDPYQACLHQGTQRHAALASDLVEEFRAPLVDALVMYMINRKFIDERADFVYKNGGCYLNDSGRRRYLKVFLQRMEELIQGQDSSEKTPRWHLLSSQVLAYKQFIYKPSQGYQPYRID